MNTARASRRLLLALPLAQCAFGQTPADLLEQQAIAQERAFQAARASQLKAGAEAARGQGAALPSQTPYVVPAPPAPAAPAALATGKAGENYQLQVISISDNRSTSGSGLVSLTLGLFGPDLAPGTLIRQANVTKALDDGGRDLMVGARPATMVLSTSLLSNNSRLQQSLRPGAAQNVTTSVTLGPSVRNAKAIARLEGTLELFAPSEQNGSLVYVKSAQAAEGRQLPGEALARSGVEFVLLTPEMIPEYRTRLGITGGPTPTAATVTSFVLDPQGALMGYVLLDAGGQPLQTIYSSGTPARGTIVFQNLPPSASGAREYQVALFLSGPAGVVTIPFSVENIPLP